VTATENVAGFGLYCFSVSEVHRPGSVEDLARTLADLRARGEPYVLRGAGRSYGDAATNPRGAVVELTRLTKIHGLDEATGILRAEPGVDFERVWRYAVPRGFWPPIVPGTMFATLGGSVAMNIHGKNGWRRGTFGEHVAAVTVLETDGSLRRIERGEPAMLDVVSGWGSGRPIVEIALEMKRIETGYLDVDGFATKDLAETLAVLDAEKESCEYLVGWVDCFPRGTGLGRGVVHLANHVHREEGKPLGLTEKEQTTGRLSDLIPKPLMLAVLKASASDLGMRLVNAAKFHATRLAGRKTARESLVQYSFLLDFVPDWRDMYLPSGFIQYQLFVPMERALEALAEAIRLQHRFGVFSYLGVVKRHRPDRYPGPTKTRYIVDGYSLALDFPVTDRNAPRLIALCRAYDELLAACGGGLYKAKDCVGSVERMAGRLGLGRDQPGLARSNATSSLSDDTTMAVAPSSENVPLSSVPGSERQ
jgi:decaprenylphospho-beta-D-ribofuranose 2-oxidase